jgi:trehalose 6-phosphate synthase/phosphatase
LVEEKSVSVAWHYRRADPRLAASGLRWLRTMLRRHLPPGSVDLLAGEQVLEIRPVGIDKGGVARRVLAEMPADALVVAMGDDHTDEHLFAALPNDALTICVGHRPTQARLRVASVHDARALLAALVNEETVGVERAASVPDRGGTLG